MSHLITTLLAALTLTGWAQVPLPAADTNVVPSVTLWWTLVPDPLVAGYNIYYGGADGLLTNKTVCGMATNLPLYNLPAGTSFCFSETTYSVAGAESTLSSRVWWTNYLLKITNQTFQLWSGTNRLLNVANPAWQTMFFRTSNGWLMASSHLLPAEWSEIASTGLTNTAPLRATNLVQWQRVP